MIQEIRALLINDNEAKNVFLMPKDFSVVPLNRVESEISNCITGGTSASIQYRCFVSDLIFQLIYGDSEFSEILKKFDNRVVVDTDEVRPVLVPTTTYVRGRRFITIDISKIRYDKNRQCISYFFERASENSVSISGGQDNNFQKTITFNQQEISAGSSWKLLEDTNTSVMFRFYPKLSEYFDTDGVYVNTDYSEDLDGGGPDVIYESLADSGGVETGVPSTFSAEVRICTPFEFSLDSCLRELELVSGLTDFVSLVGEKHPEILEKFYDEGRKDRKLFSIVLAYCLSLKEKI
jgi:hypothetical protein